MKRNENKKFTLAVETNNNKRKKRNHDIVNTNKSKKRSVNNNKRNKNEEFTLEYFAGKCVEALCSRVMSELLSNELYKEAMRTRKCI